MPRRIEPGWRMRMAQAVLRLLFGRRWHYLSPWPCAAVSAVILPVCGGKVLLAERGGAVEFAGCWSGIGGFVDLGARETPKQAALREMYEETGATLPSDALPEQPDLLFISFGQEKHEQADYTVVATYFVLPVMADFATTFVPQDETRAFRWFDRDEYMTLLDTGKIPADFSDLRQAMAHVFKLEQT